VLSHEICCDSQEVVGKLGRGIVVLLLTLTENQEGAVILRQEPVKEVESKAREAVTVGNHNVRDAPCENAFQKGLQSWALEVDTRGNVGEKIPRWVCFLELGFLALEVGLLVRRGDAGVEEVAAVLRRLAKGAGDGLLLVETLSTGHAYTSELPFRFP
jgi:hypothetical protein